MHKSLDLFQTAGAMAQHAGSRQAVVARNIANADTPGYQAQQTVAFQDVYRSDDAGKLRTTRAAHIPSRDVMAVPFQASNASTEPSPNGNSVSLEEELLSSIDVSREHNRALAIYKHGMTIIRNSIGRA